MKRLVVYGTLRRGGRFSGVMPDKGHCEVVELHGVRVYETISFFPGAQITGNDEDYVVAEVWDFEDHLTDDEWKRLINRLDGIECIGRDNNGLFKRTTVETPLGEAVIYAMNDPSLVEPTLEKDRVINDWSEIAPEIGEHVEYVRDNFGRKDGKKVKARTAGGDK